MSKSETSWGIDPVPERLRVLGGFDLALLWGNLGVSLLVVVAGAILVPALSLPSALVARLCRPLPKITTSWTLCLHRGVSVIGMDGLVCPAVAPAAEETSPDEAVQADV